MSLWAWMSLVCLLWAVGIALWGYVQQREQVHAISGRLQRAIDAEPTPVVPQAVEEVQRNQRRHWLHFAPPWVREALSDRQWMLLAVGAVLLTLLGALLTNILMALLIPLCMLALVLFFAWMRWQKLRTRCVQLLPSFIEGMVRMVVLGHTAQSAFLMAATSAKAPLSEPMLQAAGFVRAGMPVDQALLMAGKSLQLQEFNLLAAILRVSERFGGRVDRLLERVAHLIRDREQADRELQAMSAEVRVSAWILSLLPVLVGGAIIMLNASYFMQMWDDPSGRWVALAGAGLQIFGTVLLYRMAQISD